MKKLFNKILNYFTIGRIELDINKFPSMGLFYNNDFKVYIKKMSVEDILIYKKNYDSEDLIKIMDAIRYVVAKYTTYSHNYSLDDISGIDLMYIFFKIIKYTKNKDVSFIYNYNNILKTVNFTESTFKYAKLDEILTAYDKEKKCIKIDEYELKYPTVGIEKSVTNFILEKGRQNDLSNYANCNYNFMYFVPNKNKLTSNEIENLLIIFNDELPDDLKTKFHNVLTILADRFKYKLIADDNNIIDISNVNLKNVLD
jgi:hypothetical protein